MSSVGKEVCGTTETNTIWKTVWQYPLKWNTWIQCVCMLSGSVLFATPCTVACQAPLPMEFSRQQHWGGLLPPTPGIFPTQGSNPCLLHLPHWQADSLPLSYLESPLIFLDVYKRRWSWGIFPETGSLWEWAAFVSVLLSHLCNTF